MKIILMSTGLGMGGAERQVCDLADQFASMGHEVMLISLTGETVNKPTQPSIKLVALGMCKTPLGFLSAYWKTRQLISSYKPDVLHSHMVHANIFARLLRLAAEIPRLICTAHNTNEGGRLRMLAYRLTDSLADFSTNVSQDAVQAFLKKGACKPGRMIAMHNGIDTHRFHFDEGARKGKRAELGLNDHTPLLLAVGRLTEAKDYANMLQAFSLIDNLAVQPRLAIVGVGELRSQLEEEAERLGVAARVHFLGLRRDIPELMSAADLYVMSSAWEGLPLVIGEAMACENPVVATDAGGCSELLDNIGTVVPVKDPEALSRAIREVLALDTEQRKHIGKNARNRIIEHYSLQNVASTWLNIYRGCHKNEK